VVRTTTVAGKSVVRTVTVESQPAEPAAAKGPGPTAVGGQGQGAPTPAATDGAALNDQGFRLLRAGNAAAALPLLERAVSALQGSGSVTEAYALYNLALARFSTGNCDGVKDMLHESEHIQGRREEIKQLQQSVGSGCKHD
jgi:hypothetical protein